MAVQPYACTPENSLGRAIPEPESPLRSVYQRDRDRIVHSIPFRRLEYKTQVFVNFEGDHFRTRLTHSLEVAQIARAMARTLGADEDLAEAIALAHDLGHSAFGHAGEAALDQALAGFGGFDHNLQTFRIVTRLERRYAGFDGLNLTFETLEGLVKHHGPVAGPLPAAIAEHPCGRDHPARPPAATGGAARCHRRRRRLRQSRPRRRPAGRLPGRSTSWRPCRWPARRWPRWTGRFPGLEAPRRVHETIRRLIDGMVRDLVEVSRRGLAELKPASPDAIRGAGRALVAFSPRSPRVSPSCAGSCTIASIATTRSAA